MVLKGAQHFKLIDTLIKKRGKEDGKNSDEERYC